MPSCKAKFCTVKRGKGINTGVLERAREAGPFVSTNDHRLA